MSSAEQDLIQTYFAPLAGDGAAGLQDDAAVWSAAQGMETVISTDTLVEGVHFIGDEPPDLIVIPAGASITTWFELFMWILPVAVSTVSAPVLIRKFVPMSRCWLSLWVT